jgi:hypothetical protein
MPAQQQMQELPAPPEGFRPNVGMCVFHPEKGVFAALRLDTPGKAWQMPQGMATRTANIGRQHTSFGCRDPGDGAWRVESGDRDFHGAMFTHLQRPTCKP